MKARQDITRQPERWITAIVNGTVQLVERIPDNAVVIRLDDLPGLVMDRVVVCDTLAGRVRQALDER